MKLSQPIHRLKRKARLLSRAEDIPLHQALDRISAEERIGRWSLLVAKASAATPASEIFARLAPGDLVLVGARPRQGKTLMGLQLAMEAMRSGRRGAFFTLEYTEKDMQNRFQMLGTDHMQFGNLFDFDTSDAISADYIAAKLAEASSGTLAVIDYLQLLDQKRENPDLMVQIRALKSFARERGVILVFISQIDRSYDSSTKPCPDMQDVRLPNPLDLTLFDKACFLNNGEIRFSAAA